jgi:squalene-associated FAD-dependent desaturase
LIIVFRTNTGIYNQICGGVKSYSKSGGKLINNQGKVHIIGAGIAGLTAAVLLAKAGRNVAVYEASPHAGGRCRSYEDKKLGETVDNGNHLLLGANVHTLRLIEEIGAAEKFYQWRDGVRFVDVSSGDSWNITPAGFLGKRARVAGSTWAEYIKSFSLLWAGKKSVEHALGHTGRLYDGLWKPLAVSILNTPLHKASAAMFRHVMLRLFLGGSNALTAYFPKVGWGDALINPLLAECEKHGAKVEFSTRVKRLQQVTHQITAIELTNETVELGKLDSVIVAVPPFVVGDLVDEVATPKAHHAIVNVHYKAADVADKLRAESRLFWGVVGGTAEWFFVKGDVISSTTSAADELAGAPEADIAARVWQDLQKSANIKALLPDYRVLIEKRATFACDVDYAFNRPANATHCDNLVIAGDYTDTGLPATIESAVVSGKKAAKIVLATK